MFRKRRPTIDFGQHRIRRRSFRSNVRLQSEPIIDFGQHKEAASNRRQFLRWGAGMAIFSGFLAYPFIRGKKRDDIWAESRPTHGAMTLSDLSHIPNDELEYEVVDYVSAAIFREDYEDWVELLRPLSPGFRAVYATCVLEGEVDNGGFSQFFFNSSGAIAYEARDGCWLIGARQHAQIVIDAIELEQAAGTPGSFFPDSATYQVSYDDNYAYADYHTLDDRFYASAEDLSRLRIRYIREHPDQFTGPAYE